jgi:hypothetical protein
MRPARQAGGEGCAMSDPPDYLVQAIQDYAYAKHDLLRSKSAGVNTDEAEHEQELCRQAMYAAIQKYGDECRRAAQ